MVDGHVTETPVVKKKVDTPYFIGEVEALAMENTPYDLVIGNIPNAHEPSDPDSTWKPVAHEPGVACPLVTRAQSKSRMVRPLKVTKSQGIKVNSQDLVIMQNSDDFLSKIRSWIDDGKADNPRRGCSESYFRNEIGVIFRKYITSPHKGSITYKQLVLPLKLRHSVLEVAHDSILGGHLGNAKTVDRILCNFYWPGIHDDVG